MIDLGGLFKGAPRGVRRMAVVGWPLEHTLSPVMHAAAFKAMDIDGVYRAVPVPPEDWEEFLRQAQDLPLDGFNVTVPHKERAAEMGGLLPPSPFSLWKAVGAVNTLGRTPDGWRAWNTDVDGFYSDLDDLQIPVGNRRMLLIGAGGAARAILFGLHGRRSPSSVTLVDVMKDKAERLAREAGDYIPGLTITVLDQAGADVVSNSELVINASPVGLKEGDPSPVDLSTLPSTAVAYDLIYHRPTAFRSAARRRGARDHGGLGMLVQQGALAFEHWFGEELGRSSIYGPRKLRLIMREAAEAALKEKTT